MINLTAEKLAEIVGGKVLSQGESSFTGFGTDTRSDLADQLFVALKGETFDAHKFLSQACDQGARVLLVHDSSAVEESVLSRAGVVLVGDTLVALGQLATWWRRHNDFQVVAITGSNGKTTTKRMADQLLSGTMKTHTASGSFNNHWGVPFSILSASEDTEALVLEMGMNALGEISKLCKIAEPDVVVCTMVGTAHIGELGSQENIAKAKWEIYESCPDAMKIFNYDNEFTIEMHEKAKTLWPDQKFVLFSSFRKESDVFLRAMSSNLKGIDVSGSVFGYEGSAQVPVVGRHNIVNLAAACSIALALGVEPAQVWAQMPLITGEWGRNQLLKAQGGATILFDGYNANPDSMAMLMKNLLEIEVTGKKIVVLGEMFELGEFSEEKHEQLGEMVGMTDIEVIWFVGPSCRAFEAGLKKADFSKTYFISDSYKESLASQMASMLEPDDIVAVKGSRGMKLEKVVVDFDPLNFPQKS
ncbi:MAG: UDP-N-acetylmuramoyl-tripeptide--D-alanyl-D-alanine ligase [Pseudomonadota bacterium]